MSLRRYARGSKLPIVFGRSICRSQRSFSSQDTRRGLDQIREDVRHRRPEVARCRILEEKAKQGKKGYKYFNQWLSMRDRIFRESAHQKSFAMRWFRATTSDLVYDFRSWHRAQDPYRNQKITFTRLGWMRSDLVRRLMWPDLTLILFSSSTLCMYNAFLAPADCIFTLPSELFMITSMAVGLLVTFRTQCSYARYETAVGLWSAARAETRELYARILARIPMQPAATEELQRHILRKRMHGAKLAQTFPHTLKYHLSLTGQNANFGFNEDMTEEVVEQKKKAYLRDELSLIWDLNDPEELAIVDRLLHERCYNQPLQVCQELSYLNATEYCAPNPGALGHPNSEGLDQVIRALQKVVSDSERIIQTPIYTPYTVFTSRVTYVWLNLIPLGMYPLIGPVATPPASVLISFMIIGIDHIGMLVEQPFHMLPMWQFVENMDKDCAQMLQNSKCLDAKKAQLHRN